MLATLVAKSKLLVLPVYPAAWPQAKKHAFVQAMFQFYRYVASLHLMQKTGYRYRQTDRAIVAAADWLERAAARVGLGHVSDALFAGLNDLATRIGNASRAAMMRVVEGLSGVPLIGSIVTSYAAHYAVADQQRAERFSEKVSGFFERWSIKFSAEYYEAKERAARRDTPVAIEPSVSERRT